MRMWRRTDFASRLLLRWDNKAKALVVVDVQNDFCTRTLAVEDGLTVARGIAAYLQDAAASYDYIVTTQDWHIVQ